MGQKLARLRVYSDPLQHAAIAAAVVAPVARARPRVIATAVGAALAIDIDHAVAARSIRPRHTTALDQRPRTHSLVTAVTAGTIATAVAGPLHGWAAFAGLASHLLHDAGDRAAPTPVLWPWRPARQLGRRRQLAGSALLTMASAVIGRAAATRARRRGAGGAAGAGATDPLRTG